MKGFPALEPSTTSTTSFARDAIIKLISEVVPPKEGPCMFPIFGCMQGFFVYKEQTYDRLQRLCQS